MVDEIVSLKLRVIRCPFEETIAPIKVGGIPSTCKAEVADIPPCVRSASLLAESLIVPELKARVEDVIDIPSLSTSSLEMT
jgi:hypothetical protein